MEQEVKERESQTHAIGALRAASLERRVPRLVGSSANERGDGEGGRVGRREREIGGIRQLPLNVFNAAVEARKRSVEKRSVGRSVGRSLARSLGFLSLLGGDGAVWAGCGAATPASCSSFDFSSLSIYVAGGIAIAGPASML